jgi:hypothetical protein
MKSFQIDIFDIPLNLSQLIDLAGDFYQYETPQRMPTFDELKTHLRGAKIVLRSKTPELVQQEVYGLLMTHFARRGLMHEAALRVEDDPDRLSFIHAVRVVRRKLPIFTAIPPRGPREIS